MIEFPLPEAEGSKAVEMIRAIAPFLDFDKGPWVAGGVLRRILTQDSEDAYDIDVFFASEAQRKEIGPMIRDAEINHMISIGNDYAKQLRAAPPAPMAKLSPPWSKKFECKSISWDDGLIFERSPRFPPVQLISHHLYGDLGELLRDIDFTVCQMATDGRTIRCAQEAVDDMQARRLVLSGTSKVRATTRIFRYFSYGYEPTEGVMQIAETLSGQSYYDPEGAGYKAFEPAIARMIETDMTDTLLLSRLNDIIIERDGGTGTAYIYGYPFPAPMAFLFLSSFQMRSEIKHKLWPLWEKKGLGRFDYDSRPQISNVRFFAEYRKAYREAGECIL